MFVIGDCTEPTITTACFGRFYLNSAICLQSDVTLLLLNSVKIRHWLSINRGVLLFPDTAYTNTILNHSIVNIMIPALDCRTTGRIYLHARISVLSSKS